VIRSNTAPTHPMQPVTGQFGVLMSDLRGFTALTEQYPTHTFIQLLEHYFREMIAIIDRHGGRIDKFMGDSILALFDLEASDDAAYHMLSCAIDMQIAMDDINRFGQGLELPEVFMGIGLNSGAIVTCQLGSEIYSEVTILGEPVNIVARMSAFALRGQVLISEAVFRLCPDQLEIGPDFNLLIKGKKHIVKIHELQGLLYPDHKLVPSRENRRSPRVEAFLPVTYYCIEHKRIQPTPIKAEITDLSYGGMRIFTPREQHLLDEIKIVVPFATGEESSSDVYAKVLSCSAQDKGSWCISVEFSYLDEFARKSIKTLVDNLV
jgi:adenylate cyclase